jgi:hypothetical protein
MLPQASALEKGVHVLDHLPVGRVVPRVVGKRNGVDRILDLLPGIGRDLHLARRLHRILLVKEVPHLDCAHPRVFSPVLQSEGAPGAVQ